MDYWNKFESTGNLYTYLKYRQEKERKQRDTQNKDNIDS